jgi:SlyX protein
MDDIETLRARIDTLEVHVAYQDQTIEDLNNTIAAQWKQIESLAGAIRRLDDRVQRAEESSPPSPEPPPPHY